MRALLLRGGTLYGAAVLLDRLLGLLLLPVLARALDRHDFGAWSQTAVAAGMLMPLVGFAFSTAIVRSFSGDCGAAVRLRYFARLGGVVLALYALAVLGLVLAAGPVAALVYGGPAGLPLLPALALLLATEVGVDFALAWLRSLGRMGLIAAITGLRSLLRYGLVLALVAGGAPPLAQWLTVYTGVQAGVMLAVLATSALLLRRTGAAAAAAAPPPPLAELLRFCAPLVLLAVFTSLNAYLDRFLLVDGLGLDGLAVYSAAVSLCAIPGVFYSVLGFTLFPRLARRWNEGRRDEAAGLTDQSLQLFLFLSLPVALLMATGGSALLPLITTGEYRAAPAVFALLGLSVLAFGLYQITLYALLLDGRSHQVLALAVGAAVLNALLNLALVPRWGALGAAASAAVSNAALVAVAAHLARAAMPWRFPWRGLWPIAWRAAVAALPLALWALAPGSWPLFAGALLLAAGLHLGLDLARRDSVARTLITS